jgi:flagella basal body P-ring formation protein FlgA
VRTIVGSARPDQRPNSAADGRQFDACGDGCRPTVASVEDLHALPRPARKPCGPARRPPAVRASGFVSGLALALAAAAAGATPPAQADPLGDPLRAQIQAHLQQAAQSHPGLPAGARIEVELGRVDPRLRLAPCERIEPQWPAAAWGTLRVGLRCVQGPARWQVQLPAQVRVWVAGWVGAAGLAAGSALGAAHLRAAEVDLATGAVADAALIEGRVLARALAAGAPIRLVDLRPRQWFAAGETVEVVAVGPGFRVQGQGQALAPGLDGQRVRVRTDSGRVLTGVAVAPAQVEVPL